MKKRLLTLLAAALLLLSLGTSAFAVKQPTGDFYFADYANVLSPELKQRICENNDLLEWSCRGAQFVVLTVEDLDGMEIEDYAAQVLREWEIGDEKNANGVLLLLAVEEKSYCLLSGEGIRDSFDPFLDRLLGEEFQSAFSTGDYDTAVSTVMAAVLEWYDGLYGTNISQNSSTGAVRENSSWWLIVAVVVAFVLSRALGGRGRGGNRDGFLSRLFLGSRLGRGRGSGDDREQR